YRCFIPHHLHPYLSISNSVYPDLHSFPTRRSSDLSDFEHPCQALADLFTLSERGLDLGAMRLAWIGDGNNVCHSVIQLGARLDRSEEHTSELQSRGHLVCRLLLEKKKYDIYS